MTTTELLIDNGTGNGYRAADLTDTIKIVLQKIVAEARDPQKETGSYSQDFTLPFTATNRQLFRYEDDKQLVGKFKQKYRSLLVQDNQVLIQGYVMMLSIIRSPATQGFEIAVGAERAGTNLKLGDIIDPEAQLTAIKSFTPLAFSGHSTVVDSWAQTTFYPTAEVGFPHLVRGFWELKPRVAAVPGTSQLVGAYQSTYEDLGISHFTAAITKNIFTDAGYELAGDVLTSETYQKLLLLYSNSGTQFWNYGTLAPLKAQVSPNLYGGGVYDGGVVKTYDRQNDKVEVLTYPQRAYEGDLCESLGDDGVYTCKYSGIYSLRVSAKHGYWNGSSGQGGFTVFRCISDEQFLSDSQLPNQGSWGNIPDIASLGLDTLAVGDDSAFTFTTTLTEGKQYQVQRYVQISTPAANGDSTYNPNETNFFIQSCNGPLMVNPALFLPELKQSEFLQAIFKIFNLYYELNADTKTVTLFARDDFFQESLSDIVDMNPYLSVDSMDDLPFSDAQIAATYLQWAPDDNDYLLKNTDYLKAVNGPAIDGATVLPFAPLGYLEVELSDTSGHVGYDTVPAIIPTTDLQDQSVLDDENATAAPGSWVPRLALYQDANWLRPDIARGLTTGTGNYRVALGRVLPVTQTVTGNYQGGGYPYVAIPPKLSFFNATAQPRYKIAVDSQLRSFAVTASTTPTIYDQADGNFLADVTRVPELDTISLATNIDAVVNPRGFFYQLYANDILTNQLSYYVQGAGRINPALFNKLNGRQVLALDQDLYLLDSIVNYEVGAELATYKLYKLLLNNPGASGSGSSSGSTSGSTGGSGNLIYTSTQSANATCPTNTQGASVSATATRTSYVSQAAADTAAYNAALQAATSQLVCTVVSWGGYAVADASCSSGSYGYDAQARGTYTSTISQADADAHAQQVAHDNAVAKLVCYINPTNPNPYLTLSNQLEVMIDLTPRASYAAALAATSGMEANAFGINNLIFIGKPVYTLGAGDFYALIDGFYSFRYYVGTNTSTQAFRILNGVVDSYQDTIGGATGAPDPPQDPGDGGG